MEVETFRRQWALITYLPPEAAFWAVRKPEQADDNGQGKGRVHSIASFATAYRQMKAAERR